jgi:hypothetical protein
VTVKIDYLNENSREGGVNSLLRTYCMSHTANFATRTQNNSSTATDNIFVHNAILCSSSTYPKLVTVMGW